MMRNDAFLCQRGRGCQESTENNPEDCVHLELCTYHLLFVEEVKNANRIAREADVTSAGEMTSEVKSVFSERKNLREGIL